MPVRISIILEIVEGVHENTVTGFSQFILDTGFLNILWFMDVFVLDQRHVRM